MNNDTIDLNATICPHCNCGDLLQIHESMWVCDNEFCGCEFKHNETLSVPCICGKMITLVEEQDKANLWKFHCPDCDVEAMCEVFRESRKSA